MSFSPAVPPTCHKSGYERYPADNHGHFEEGHWLGRPPLGLGWGRRPKLDGMQVIANVSAHKTLASVCRAFRGKGGTSLCSDEACIRGQAGAVATASGSTQASGSAESRLHPVNRPRASLKEFLLITRSSSAITSGFVNLRSAFQIMGFTAKYCRLCPQNVKACRHSGVHRLASLLSSLAPESVLQGLPSKMDIWLLLRQPITVHFVLGPMLVRSGRICSPTSMRRLLAQLPAVDNDRTSKR